MGANSSIAWTDDTWNPWRGCRPVSPGCVNCYAEELVERLFGQKFSQRIQSKSTLRDPHRWNKNPWVCDSCGKAYTGIGVGCDCDTFRSFHRRRVFSLSLGDWLDPEVPVPWLAQMLDTVRQCPNLDFLLLTKRIELFYDRITKVGVALEAENEGEFFESDAVRDLDIWLHEWVRGKPPHNVWLGVSVEDQKRGDERIPLLLKTPAAIWFLSVEPLLENVQLEALRLPRNHRMIDRPALPGFVGIDWVIVGGESGQKRRDCGVHAIESVVEQCVHAGVPVFVKQDCHRYPGQRGRIPEAIFNMKQFPKI